MDVHKPVHLIPLYLRDKRIHGLQPFQDLVDKAPEGSVLKVPAGNYSGPVHLKKRLTIEGEGEVVIDGGDKGTVFVLETNEATLRNLTITGSGESHDADDTCLNIRGHGNLVENLNIADCLFGIDLKQADHNIVRNNKVRSKDFELGVRGDGIRLWYSNDNLIENNLVTDTRDMVAWYSHRNIYRGNEGRRSRYSIHFMFANDNIVENNRFYDNAVGVYFMYMEGGARATTSSRTPPAPPAWASASRSPRTSCSRTTRSSTARLAWAPTSRPSSPTPPSASSTTASRSTASPSSSPANSAATRCTATPSRATSPTCSRPAAAVRKASRTSGKGTTSTPTRASTATRTASATPRTKNSAYADRIWMEIPNARFFKTSPVLELLDFLERLAPFSTPDLQARDEKPLYIKPERRIEGSAS